MKGSHSLEAITAAIEPIVKAGGYELIEVIWGSSYNRRTLTVFVDKPGGVLLDDCQTLSRQIGALLDESELVAGSYVLEVSSPGAERRLKGAKDFERFAGRYALIITREPIPEVGGTQVYGYLRGLADDAAVKLELEDAGVIHIPMDQITKARLAIKL
ncbi:MAG: ribosome maturation factor RimP [Firmicutes bacterium]|nr:ribosome maturation factor RimP [Bacillota bacterium]